MSGGVSPAFEAIVLENGEFWGLYGQSFPNTFIVRAFVQGTGATASGTFSAADMRDFGSSPAITGALTATYAAGSSSLAGTIVFPSSTVTFSASRFGEQPWDYSGIPYNYDLPASLDTVAGHWDVLSLSGEGLGVNISSSGTLAAVGTSGCAMAGTVKPRASGKNVFDLTLIFGPAPCALPGQQARGIALSYQLASGQRQLVAAVTDASRTQGTAVFGVR